MIAEENRFIAMLHPGRIAGLLLIAGFLIPLLALIFLITGGAFRAFSAGLQGSLAQKASYSATFRLVDLLYAVAWIVQLLGFGLLAQLLLRARDESLAIPAFIAILIAAILGFLHGTFHMSVETWAAQEAARTGSVPEVYEPLRDWMGTSFRLAYVAHLAATAGFGWSILRAGLLAPWVGQITLGWGVLWLVGYLVGAGAPGILFIMPAIIGVELLRHG